MAVFAEAGFQFQVELSQQHLIGLELAIWCHSAMVAFGDIWSLTISKVKVGFGKGLDVALLGPAINMGLPYLVESK